MFPILIECLKYLKFKVEDFYLNESLNLFHFLMLKKKQETRPLRCKNQEARGFALIEGEESINSRLREKTFNFHVSYFNRVPKVLKV